MEEDLFGQYFNFLESFFFSKGDGEIADHPFPVPSIKVEGKGPEEPGGKDQVF